jgi:TetR/AcrR family transcriptional regulator, cholesterol catabolism regulator
MKPNKTKPAGKKSEISRAQIVDAAALLFRDQGYAATTIRQIAGSIGMQAGSVYYYFNSKDEILNEILLVGERSVMAAMRAHVAAAGPDASYRERIECAIEGHLRALLEKSVYSSAYIRVYGQLPEDIKRLHRRRRNAYSKLWDELFTAAQGNGEIRPDISVVPLRLFVLGALNWTVEWFDPEIHSVDMLVERTALFIFEGISVKKRRHRKQSSSHVKSDSNSETET